MKTIMLFHRTILQVLLVVVITLLLQHQPCQALFCADWCIEPYCSCQDIIPGLRSFLENTFNFLAPLNDENCLPQTGSCRTGFSGRQCRCGFSRTNIADNSLIVPDSMKGSLTVTTTGSASGTLLLAGTWQAPYEATNNDPNQFISWFDTTDPIDEENVWSIAKTTSGNELIAGHNWIRLRKAGQSTFVQVLDIGTQGGFVVLDDDQVFAGTFQGLYRSTDGGETWAKTPTDCEPYNFPDDPTTDGPPFPKPPNEAKYCKASVTHLFLLEDGSSLIAFYMGYGGAHQIQLQNGDDPLLPESWVAFPSFQDTEACQSGYCHTYDAAILSNYMYVAFQSLSMVRIDLTTRQTWEQVTVGTDSISGNNLHPTAMTTANDGSRLIVATSDGLYQSNDGTVWVRISDDDCSDRNKPPLMNLGMVEVPSNTVGRTTIVFGTVLGPWVYTE